MEDFQFEVLIGMSPTEVFAALTTKAGIQGWWTPDCDVASKVGQQLKVRFGEMFHTYEIELLVPDEALQWRCVEHFHNLPGLTKFDEWVGTRLHFQLSLVDRATNLSFKHEGLVPKLDCYSHCSERWPFFLGVSLKGYVETGAGQPYINQEPVEFDT